MMQSRSFKTVLILAMVVGVAFTAPKPGGYEMYDEVIIPSGGNVNENIQPASATWEEHPSAFLINDGSPVFAEIIPSGGVVVNDNVQLASAPMEEEQPSTFLFSDNNPVVVEVIPSEGVVVNDNVQSASAPLEEDLHPSGFLFEDGTAASVADNGSGAGVPAATNPASGGSGNGEKPGSAVAGTPPHHQGGSGNKFFEMVFAIPINILQSLKMYLNLKQLHQQGQQGSVGAAVTSGIQNPGTSMMVQTKYDALFNVPITILRSVQNLLTWLTR